MKIGFSKGVTVYHMRDAETMYIEVWTDSNDSHLVRCTQFNMTQMPLASNKLVVFMVTI